MIRINAEGLDHKALNDAMRGASDDCIVEGCCGQRFIAAGMSDKRISIERGIPGNALGAYLNGATITVHGNAQDAVGDTMNGGCIVVHGSIGDAAGYAMRGGTILVKGNAGYRAGIHMKAYRDKVPALVIGGHAGSFLGEYQAGGLIVVLNLDEPDSRIVGNFPCTGMHGGIMLLRSTCEGIKFPKQVTAHPATKQDLENALPQIRMFCDAFDCDEHEILDAPFTVITPDNSNIYTQMYVAN